MRNKWEQQFFNIYSKKFNSEEQVNKVIESARETLELTFDNTTNMPLNKTGVLMGKIQSGKTSNFLAITSLAMDQYYDIVVIFAGKDISLVDQNASRLVELFKENNNNPLEINNQKPNIWLSRSINKSDYAKITKTIKRESKAIFLVMKNTAHLQTIYDLINSDDVYKEKNILFIDDEGDQGTYNTKATNKKNKDSDYDEFGINYIESSAWYKKIKNIRDSVKHYFYLSVTATPFVNLLTFIEDHNHPTFLKLTEPGKGYKGLYEFHQENSDKIITISKQDTDNLKTKFNSNDLFSNKSLLEAISTFIVSYFLVNKNLKNQNKQMINNVEMIVHVDRSISTHKNIAQRIEEIINYFYTILDKYDDDNLMMQSFSEFVNFGLKVFNINNENLKKEIFHWTKRVILTDQITTILDNASTKKDDKELSEINQTIYNIHIGSALIERGITFSNLLVTYFTISPKLMSLDTQLQRARWFGYRENIFDYMKIFTTEELKKDYELMNDVETTIWNEVEALESMIKNTPENNSIMELYNDFLSHIELPMLRKSMRYTGTNRAATEIIRRSGWHAQKIIKDDNEFLDENNRLKRIFDDKIFPKLGINDFNLSRSDDENSKYKILDYSSISNFKKEIGTIFWNQVLAKTNTYMSKFSDYEFENTSAIRIIYMNADEELPIKRTAITHKGNDYEIQIFSSAKKNSEVEQNLLLGKYVGDRHIFEYSGNKDKILLLIYRTRVVSEIDKEVVVSKGYDQTEDVYALYIPGKMDEFYVTGRKLGD